MYEFAIQTKNLSYQFTQGNLVLNKLSLNIPKRSIYGFLGPNGAGKSTTMQLLTGLLNQQNENAVFIFGEPLLNQLPQVFSRIGSIIETPHLYLHLTGYDNLKFIATIRKVALTKIDEVLEIVELTKVKHTRASRYSLGMKQRLAIAMTLLGNPELLILDEPVNGLDPQGIIDIRNLLKKINKTQGTTILISSHLLTEIEKTCTHVAILDKGSLVFEGQIQDLKTKNNNYVRIKTSNVSEISEALSSIDFVVYSENEFGIPIQTEQDIPYVVKQLVSLQVPIFEIKTTVGLEDWFTNLTKK